MSVEQSNTRMCNITLIITLNLGASLVSELGGVYKALLIHLDEIHFPQKVIFGWYNE